jgi:hypothetical protein
MSQELQEHPLSGNATKAWEEMSKSQRKIKIQYKAPKSENSDPNK